MGTLVGAFGIFSEYFFFQDYWRPPLLIQFGPFGGVEDFLFGFAAGGIGAVVFDLAASPSKHHSKNAKKWIIYTAFLIQFISLILFASLLSLNSITASSIGLLLLAAIINWIRPDLIYNSLVSTLICAGLLVGVEALLLITFGGGYLENYFLLDKSEYVVWGVIPLTELLWGLTFGAAVGPLYEVYTGE